MKRLRTHIIRLVVLLLVCSGFSLSIVQPAQAKRSTNAFANWLSKMAKSANGTDLQHKLEDLRNSDDQLDKVIEEASRIVHQNNEEFIFSVESSLASSQLYELLLVEWNQFQTADAMTSVPVHQTVKLLVPAKSDTSPFLESTFQIDNRFEKIGQHVERFFNSYFAFPYATIPMIGGVAIGAP